MSGAPLPPTSLTVPLPSTVQVLTFIAFDLMVDWLWASRANVAVGVPDALMAFGEEVFIDAFDQLNSQPFFIFAAKLCPPGVEASMFALFMGLSNFGYAAGSYLGSFVLKLFGGVEAPEYENIGLYIWAKFVMRFLPVLLVPFLVPPGCPADTAKEMGAKTGSSTLCASSSEASDCGSSITSREADERLESDF